MSLAETEGREVLIALGASLGDRVRTLDEALRRIGAFLGSTVEASPVIETAAVTLPGEENETYPPYLNAVAVARSSLQPREILAGLLRIEAELGRDRAQEGGRWRPRPIDLDLLAVGDLRNEDDFLVLPHPRLHERDFVLRPLCEVRPGWRHPLLGKSARELLAGLGQG